MDISPYPTSGRPGGVRFGARLAVAVLGGLACLAWTSLPVRADPPTARENSSAAQVAVNVPDAELLDQNGQPARFISDVVGDRIAVVSFVYTRCTTACPLTAALLSKLQEALGDRLDREVRLVSLTLDPDTDTSARLKAYSQHFHARPGWVWLTGAKPIVDRLLKGLGAYTADFRSHPPLLMIGDGRRKTWIRLYGAQSPTQILAHIERLRLAARGD